MGVRRTSRFITMATTNQVSAALEARGFDPDGSGFVDKLDGDPAAETFVCVLAPDELRPDARWKAMRILGHPTYAIVTLFDRDGQWFSSPMIAHADLPNAIGPWLDRWLDETIA